jgi:hypothetical protein
VVAAAAVLAGALAPSAAWAESAENTEWDGGWDVTSERRSNVAFGVAGGLALGDATGSLNEVEQIGNSDFEASTGVAPGSSFSFWIGGALRDFLTIAPGGGFFSLQGNDVTARGGWVGLHLDAYPLYDLGGLYRDLGIASNIGVGLLNATDAADEQLIEGGAMGAVSFGVFWEGLRFWRAFGAGPSLAVQHLFGQSADATLATLGLRLSAYTGPKASRPAQTARR